MNRFDEVVQEALRERSDLAVLRPVVEKELLHHDILREMGTAGLLRDLVFMGGTCLRLCHGSPRLSEDLDFTTSLEPSLLMDRLANLGPTLETRLFNKYQLPVAVSEPRQTPGLVRTWKVRITTRPARTDLPTQRIHIDVQAIPARDPQPMLPRNPYRVEMGTSGLIIVASSLPEILADKLIAVALREHRIKWRDVWDIAWLTQRDVVAEPSLIGRKAADRGLNLNAIGQRVNERMSEAETLHHEFIGEMNRFLPPGDLRTAVNDPRYWEYLVRLVPTLLPAG